MTTNDEIMNANYDIINKPRCSVDIDRQKSPIRLFPGSLKLANCCHKESLSESSYTRTGKAILRPALDQSNHKAARQPHVGHFYSHR